jgi:uncharacterized membrane protein YjjB (DUF3815 family)
VSPIDRDLLISRVLVALAALGLVLGVFRRDLLWIAFVAIVALIIRQVLTRRGGGA